MAAEMGHYPNQNPFFRASRTTLGELLHLGLNIQVIGRENLKGINKEQPAIFVFAPHSGHGDSWVVYHCLRENGIHHLMVEAAADYWFNDRAHIFLASATMPAIPYPRNAVHAIQSAQEHVAMRMLVEGYSVLLAGEGGRNDKSIKDREIKTGFVDLANLASMPVIPVGIYGYEGIIPKGSILDLSRLKEGHGRKRITVVFGQPREYELIEDDGLRSQARKRIAHDMKSEFVTMSQHHPYK